MKNSTLVVRCSFSAGAKVRVKSPIKVYHVGKFKEGLDLQGMEGVVQADVRQHKGQELSATLPWKVQFEAKDGDGKPVKVIAHLVRSFCSRSTSNSFRALSLTDYDADYYHCRKMTRSKLRKE